MHKGIECPMERATKLISAEEITAIAEAGRILRRGGLVAFPTETVYGIGANALDEAAVAGVFEAKGRPQDNPLIVHVTEMKQVRELARCVSNEAEQLAEAFWPGPLTILFPKRKCVPHAVTAGLDTVAIRMPSHPVAQAIVRESGVPVAAPSANRSGRPSPTTAAHCVEDLWGRVDLIVNGGECPVGVESTVLLLSEEGPRILRPGAVTSEMLARVLGDVEVDRTALEPLAEKDRVLSPGMKYAHYAPKARITIVRGSREQFLAYLNEQRADHAMVFDEDLPYVNIPAVSYGPEQDAATQARRLFAALRELDALGAHNVCARAPEKQGVGMAVYNRLVRAAGFRIVDFS